MSSFEPTAHTSSGALPQTPASDAAELLSGARNAWPSQCKIVPATPTNHTSSGALPQTPWRSAACGPALLHVHPFRETPGIAASGERITLASTSVGLTLASPLSDTFTPPARTAPPHASAPRKQSDAGKEERSIVPSHGQRSSGTKSVESLSMDEFSHSNPAAKTKFCRLVSRRLGPRAAR